MGERGGKAVGVCDGDFGSCFVFPLVSLLMSVLIADLCLEDCNAVITHEKREDKWSGLSH